MPSRKSKRETEVSLWWIPESTSGHAFWALFPPKVITFIVIFSKAPAGFLRPFLSVNRRLDGPLSFHHVRLSSYPSSHLQNVRNIFDRVVFTIIWLTLSSDYSTYLIFSIIYWHYYCTLFLLKKISETYYLSFSVLKIFASFQPTSASFNWKPEIQPSCTMTIFLKNNSRKCKRKKKGMS